MRWRTPLILRILGILVLVTPAAAAGLDELTQWLPGVQVELEGPAVATLWGRPLGGGTTPEAAADAFVREYGGVFGVDAAELIPGNPENQLYTQPVGVDPATGAARFTLVYYTQQRDGVPVYDAGLKVLVQNLPGNPVVLVRSSVRDLGGFTAAARPIREAAGQAAASAAHPGVVNFTPAELVVWAGTNRAPAAPSLGLTFVGDGIDPAGLYRKWRFVCDAAGGAVLHAEDLVRFTDVTGSVSGMATTGPKSDTCNPEVMTPMPFARVLISGGNSAYADAAGLFTIVNGGAAPVTVQSPMTGLYFAVDNVAGAEETLNLMVTPPGPADFVHNAANTAEQIRAQVNGYIQANVVRSWVLAQNASYPTIAGQTNFPVKVNRNDSYCPGNAWYDGSSINFCLASGTYPNTAYSGVVHHEYGHHVVECAPYAGQDEYGEGMGDCIAMLIVDDPVMGYGFLGNCNSGIRTADNNCQYSSNCSTCGSEIHDCGQLLSGAIWSVRCELLITEPQDYLAITSYLTLNSILLHVGGGIDPSICIDFLVLDDDDGDLQNGTPHFTEITTGFAAHGLWGGLPPDNDDCAQAAIGCPGTYSFSTSGMTVDGSASCGNSNTTPDVWFKYRPATGGTLALRLCDSGYDTVLSVHTGCPGTSANQVGCNDDTGWFGACGWLPTDQSALDVGVTAGQLYYIRVSGAAGATGNYVLDVSGPACLPFETCDDGIQNQGEQRIDCGGPCPACECTADSGCSDGDPCNGEETCDAWGQCQPGTFADCNGNGRADSCDVGDGSSTDLNHNGVPDECEPLGDLNCNGATGFDDINPFVLALSNPPAYAEAFPGCDILRGDINGDGQTGFADINAFVTLLSSR